MKKKKDFYLVNKSIFGKVNARKPLAYACKHKPARACRVPENMKDKFFALKTEV